MMMTKVKETTGIVGLDVVPNARQVLIGLYSKTLKEIQAVPEDEGYRKAVESFTRHRLEICQEETDWQVIEKRLGCGQVEELIEEAEDELKLIDKMIGLFFLYFSLSLCLFVSYVVFFVFFGVNFISFVRLYIFSFARIGRLWIEMLVYSWIYRCDGKETRSSYNLEQKKNC